MKKIKKLMGVMFAIMMTFILATPAFAAGTSNRQGKITINNAEIGRTYKAYRLFDLSLDASNKNYGYTLNETWKEFFTTGEGKGYVTIDKENGNVKLVDETEAGMQALATAAQAYAEKGSLSAEREQKATSEKIVFDNLPLGYYMVTTNAGGLCALDTTNPDTVMYEKNQKPTISKSANKTNAAYGETVHYTIPITRGGYIWGDYIIKDIMTGLDMTEEQQNNVTIKVKAAEQQIVNGWTKKYTPGDGSNTLEVTIPADVLKQYDPGTVFVLEYDATAKKTISMDNKVSLKYHNSPSTTEETPPYEVKVANYEFLLKKTNEQKEVLNGATFELYTDAACTENSRMKFIEKVGEYRPAENHELDNATSTITAGQAKIEGLAAGVYYLKEIAAPDGYNKLVNPVKIEIIANLNTTSSLPQFKDSAFDDTGKRLDPTIKMNDNNVIKEGNEFILTVINKTGTELPSTGGIGTTVFYVIGGVLILAAVVVLMVKKRMSH